jgi:hypothetical protein
MNASADEPVFCSCKGTPYRSFRAAFEPAVRRAELKDCPGYDLWHTGVCCPVIAGVYPVPVKELIRAYRQHNDVAVYASLQ